MKGEEEHITTTPADKPETIVELRAQGSWVYKYHIREVLSLQRSDQYLEEIRLLMADLDGFEALYVSNSRKDRVRVEVARLIVSTILERAFGVGVEVRVRYGE